MENGKVAVVIVSPDMDLKDAEAADSRANRTGDGGCCCLTAETSRVPGVPNQ